MASPPIAWVFDELPPSGARRGGYAAEHAFRHQIGTFVREVCQNANDQALADPTIAFEFSDLSGDPLTDVQAALDWPGLRAHLDGAGQTATPSGRRLAEFLAEFDHRDRLLVLRIEDRGTVGLTGDEDGEGSHFRALCKDTLFSVKRSDDAGGSYGLGKSVLWAFSGLSTVVFASTPSQPPKRPRSQAAPRLIGRVELPFHEVEGVGYTGPGWFGREVERSHGRRAESLWAKPAAALAEQIGLARPLDSSGTSILVLGFRDPTADQPATVAELEAEFRAHAARWFWPAMQADQRRLAISVGDAPVRAEDFAEFAPFVDCWRRRDQAKPKLERPGDVARVPIAVELPRPRAGGRKLRGQVELLVRLADEDDDSGSVRRLASFRGPGMVVEYRDLGRMAGLRPFHAVLACGHARDPDRRSPADEAIERFLRDAEPPGHDAWDTTAAVKDAWTRGYGQVFTRLWEGVYAALRQLLAPVSEAGVVGPERLRKRFPLGRVGSGGGKGPSAFHFREFAAELVEHRWRFRGRIEPELGARAWSARISMHHLGEDGAEVAPLAITELRVDSEQIAVDLREGTAELEVPLGVLSVIVEGCSAEPIPELEASALGLRVFGQLA